MIKFIPNILFMEVSMFDDLFLIIYLMRLPEAVKLLLILTVEFFKKGNIK